MGSGKVFIRTRSGRYLLLEHIIGFDVVSQKVEIDGKRVLVFEVIAYLPGNLLPAVLGIYYNEKDAYEWLNYLVGQILKTEKGIVFIPTEI
ncbi:hypothetical protein [Desulfurobacterium atlanticum]|uniref:Uncharacterized protein n=1 Tax=Desulfurobacterium atlanticum TaxID=240169 RepID=A0A238XS73_9BACT|nr:hypothetical protein [Desulfurobacterium atlanticum]SNR61896.1 hypothetical protein SAMN06265340_101236 [Desulfurobacterium atlanticum]